MVTCLILLPASAEAVAIASYLRERLVPTLESFPGVRSVVVSSGPLMSPAGPAPYGAAVVVTLSGMEAMMAFAQSPDTEPVRTEGESLGATILMFQTAE
jgi:hypothetical protein